MKLLLAGYASGRLLGRELRRQITNSREKIKYSTDVVKPGSKASVYFRSKYGAVLVWYEGLMKKHTPTAFDVYGSLKIGVTLLYREFRTYWTVRKRLKTGLPLSALTRKELEVYYKIPNDIAHVTPALVIISIPSTYWIIFPLLYIYPKQLLSPQFWTSRQLRYFEVQRHLNRVQYQDSVLWHLQRCEIKDQNLKGQSLELLTLLRNGQQPSTKDILRIKPLFHHEGGFALHKLGYRHLRALSLSHGLRFGNFMPYRKTRRFGGLLWQMDRSLAKESIAQLTEADLQQCCFMRGFNPVGLSRDEAEQYIDRWLRVSLELRDQEVSLLLHSPIFLAYNHKNNFGNTFL